ncbi:type II toxin-antitoxin system VapC family toxin [Brevibacterium spongiae]|uniref:Ribonuclease VapC n=1 Tax=Brevibacterium spongiae TaxID=2909672 RepID=A0ABY5SPF6_9MICO|nr:type II toxin-antitoxin system VapC family toxin [Brevibacterium spongiae]UVI36059.1 type II toxin-antitoxin system VapC family toxin [Brevibacterium spongiae]
MILVDTSVWIDHLHQRDEELVRRLEDGAVGSHSAVIEELALGSIRSREEVLSSLEDLFRFPTLTHEELMFLISSHSLWGRGLSVADTHLLGSVMLIEGALLWTRDKRLRRAAEELGRAH